MKIQQILIDNKEAIFKFQEWYRGAMPLAVFLDADFEYQLGYFIMFLADNNIGIVANQFCYAVYRLNDRKVIKAEEQHEEYFIANWIESLDIAFKHLIKPF